MAFKTTYGRYLASIRSVQQIDCFKSIYSTYRNGKPYDPVDWITKCIVDEYDFQENERGDEWTWQPPFREVLQTREFHSKAEEVRQFFQDNKDWDTTKGKYNKHKLLMITAARYLLVTSILYIQNGENHIPCSEKRQRRAKNTSRYLRMEWSAIQSLTGRPLTSRVTMLGSLEQNPGL